METWQIVVLFALALILVFAYMRRKTAVAVGVATSAGVKSTSLKTVPVYGTVAKGLATVGRPLEKVVVGSTGAVSGALKHIPVVGNILALPTDIAGSVVSKTFNFLGID